MATATIGRSCGRANALTAITPLKWWGPLYLRVLFWQLGRTRVEAFAPIDRLQFVYSIRWTVLPAFDRPKRFGFGRFGFGRFSLQPYRFRPNDQRPQLLFEANFEGDWDEYLDNLAEVYDAKLDKMFMAGLGYPGAINPRLFKAYIRAHDHLPEDFVSAYPEIATTEIRQELLARYGPAKLRAIEEEGFGRHNPQWSTFLVPLQRSQVGTAAEVARRRSEGSAGVHRVFLTTGRIHFARLVVCDQASGPWLLITLTHDGEVGPIVEDLFANDTEGLLRALCECAEGSDAYDSNVNNIAFVIFSNKLVPGVVLFLLAADDREGHQGQNRPNSPAGQSDGFEPGIELVEDVASLSGFVYVFKLAGKEFLIQKIE